MLGLADVWPNILLLLSLEVVEPFLKSEVAGLSVFGHWLAALLRGRAGSTLDADWDCDNGGLTL